MDPKFQSIFALAKALNAEDVPSFLASLEEIRVTALSVLMRPALAPPDELLDVKDAAKRLHVSADYLYRHSSKFPFCRRIGKKLLFSSSGLDAYLRKSK